MNQEGCQRGSGHDLFKVLFQPLCVDAEENQEKPYSG